MIVWLASSAVALEVDVGGHAAVLALGDDHELYDPLTAPPVAQPWSAGLGARLGVHIRPWLTLEGELDGYGGPTEAGPAALLDVRGGPRVVLRDRLGPVDLHVTAGAGGLAMVSADRGTDVDLALHAGPGFTVELRHGLGLRADWRLLATARRGRASRPSVQHQVTLGLVAHLGGAPPPVVVPDTDGDGVLDDVDACPSELETDNGMLDDDGCPDRPAEVVLRVLDRHDRPISGATVSFGDAGPSRITDATGSVTVGGLEPRAIVVSVTSPLIHDVQRELRLVDGHNALSIEAHWAPGAIEVRITSPSGAPGSAEIEARSLTGATERWTVTPDDARHVLPPGMWLITAVRGPHHDARNVQVGTRSSLVTVAFELDPPPRVVEPAVPIRFTPGTSRVRPDAEPALCELADTLAGPVTVEGYADERRLSRARADAVAEVLVRCGVARERITALGHDEVVPRDRVGPAVVISVPGE